jgi:hypothetical protein
MRKYTMNNQYRKSDSLQQQLNEAVKRHLPKIGTWADRLKTHCYYGLPHVSVLAKMTPFDRDTVIAYHRFKMMERIANVRSGFSPAGLSSLNSSLSRLEKVAKAFAEAVRH